MAANMRSKGENDDTNLENVALKKRKLCHNTGSKTNDTFEVGACRWISSGLSRLRYHIALGLNTPVQDDCIGQCGRSALRIIQDHPDQVLQLAHEKLHTWPYRDVPDCWRRLYEEASLHKVVKLLDLGLSDEIRPVADGGGSRSTTVTADKHHDSLLDSIIGTLDMAIFLSGAPGRKALVDSTFELLLSQSDPGQTKHQQAQEIKYRTPTVPVLHSRHPIKRVSDAMDMEAFQKHLRDDPTPLIIPGLLEHWPAMSKWNDPDYLLHATLKGRRLVPVELGRSYTDEDWGQTIMKFGDFLHTHLIEKPPPRTDNDSPTTTSNATAANPKQAPPTAYLAQHDLFAQLPLLRNDITIPDLCYTDPQLSDPDSTTPQLDAPLLNAWLGPPGTQSPLHTDPYHNILAQPVGHKYIRLYPASETPRLYPRGTGEDGVDMGNTSSVDMSGEAARVLGRPREDGEAEGEKWPEFANARYLEAILGPGECLYVPVGWWHYVESLSTSFSVSFWWN